MSLCILHAIGEIVPHLADDEREELFLVLIALLEHLQRHNAETRSVQFAAVEGELAAAFRNAGQTRA